MKLAASLVAAALLLADTTVSQAAIRIADDRGGQIGSYISKYQRLHTSGQSVVIDGLCASACTLVLSAVPRDRICVTSRAALGFHAAYDFAANGRTITNPGATMMLYSAYPRPVQRWIDARGGLKPQIIFLHGKQLEAMYQPCRSMGHEFEGIDRRSARRPEPSDRQRSVFGRGMPFASAVGQ